MEPDSETQQIDFKFIVIVLMIIFSLIVLENLSSEPKAYSTSDTDVKQSTTPVKIFAQ